MSKMEMIERASKMTVEELENAEFFTEMGERWTVQDMTWISVIRAELKNRKRV